MSTSKSTIGKGHITSSQYLWQLALLAAVLALAGLILGLRPHGTTPLAAEVTPTSAVCLPLGLRPHGTPLIAEVTPTSTVYLPLILRLTVHTPPYYFVSPTGSDQNPGSFTQPWKTIQKAANTMVAGDTVYIRAGTYPEQVIPQNSGSADNYISYIAYPGETVTIDGASLSLDTWDGLFHIRAHRAYIRVSGLRVINAHGGYDVTGIRVDDSSNIIVDGNYTYNTESSGISVWRSNNVVVEGNEIEFANNGGGEENLSIAGSYSVEVKNNHVHHGFNSPAGGEGINIKTGSHDIKVYNNRVHDQPKLAFGLDGWTDHTYNIEYFGNVAYNCSYGFIMSSEQGGLTENIKVYNNIAYSNGSAGFAVPTYNVGLMKNVEFINNTAHGNHGGIRIMQTNVEGIVIRNNIVSQNGSFQISVVPGAAAQTTVDHNLFYGSGSVVGSDPVVGNPLFVNPGGADFHLQSGSPAIDTGSSLGAPGDDFEGNLRPQGSGYDIGAYEFVVLPPLLR